MLSVALINITLQFRSCLFLTKLKFMLQTLEYKFLLQVSIAIR